jgi:fructose-1,6-bisphosphatase/inositol monophosphatase family enzyme
MDSAVLLEAMREAAERVRTALDGLDDWGPAETLPGQYRSDLVADEAALPVLLEAGLDVLSEESGVTVSGSAGLLAVLDPVDGSTNASRNIPWFATSICVLDDEGPFVALVANQATGERYEAVRGEGASRNGQFIVPRSEASLSRAVLGLSGYPPSYLGWRQFRALGACALDLCAVADGTLDGYVDCSQGGHAPWDYLGGALVCTEAGAAVADAYGRELAVTAEGERRIPMAGCTESLLRQLVAARKEAFGGLG